MSLFTFPTASYFSLFPPPHLSLAPKGNVSDHRLTTHSPFWTLHVFTDASL